MPGDLRASLDAPPRQRFRYNPGLDGLRGLGILAVMFGHYVAGLSEWALTRFFGVSLTIDWFFVLSGYLITALLLEEWSTRNSVSMRNFYVRRGLRLLPALYVLLGVVLLLAFLTSLLPISEKLAVAETGAAAFYVYPVVLVAKGEQAFLFHLWTLSVEEWFYFLWPVFLVIFGLRPGTRRRFRLVLAGLLGLVTIGLYVRTLGGDNAFTNLFAALRPDSLAWGSLLAIFMRWLQDVRSPSWDRALSIIGPIGVVGAVYFTWFATFPRPPGLDEEQYHEVAFRSWNYQLGIFCAVLLILHIANKPGGWLVKGLSWRPFVYLGIISYALYLWHQPIFLVLNSKEVFNSDPTVADSVQRTLAGKWGIGLLAAVLSLAVAWLSRRYVELPALRQKQRFEQVEYAGKR